jgi:SAM-dependent methyltransferase
VLGVFDHLAGRGVTAAEVARASGAAPPAMAILLDALVGLGLLRKRGARYTNGPDAARHLVSTSPLSLCDLIRFAANRYPEWARLPEVALTGKPARPHDMYQHDTGETRAFIRGMHNLAVARGDARRLPGIVDLSRARTLVDLGGGPGTYAMHLCRRYPRLQATVIDFRGSLGAAREILAEHRMEDRVALREGNIFTDPIGGPWDAALVSNIVHGEDFETNRRFMKKVFDALSPGGLIIVKDHLMDRSLTRPAGGAVFALTMLMYTPGRCYGTHEIRGWLEEAGFRGAVKRRVPGTTSVAVLIAHRGQA